MSGLRNFEYFVEGYKAGLTDPTETVTKQKVLDMLEELLTDLMEANAATPDALPHAQAMAKLLEIDKHHFCSCAVLDYGRCDNCKKKAEVLAAYRKDFP